MSATLSAHGKSELRQLARKASQGGMRVTVTGYVQQSVGSSNDQSLLQLRARNVASYLKQLGVEGRYTVHGPGVRGEGANARRVEVTVTYQR